MAERPFEPSRPWPAQLAGGIASRLDLLAVVLLVLSAGWLRATLQDRAPLFIHADSTDYYLPAYGLARGSGFDLLIYRTPGYPLFVALIVWLLGEDLQAIGAVQHGLGVLVAVLAYLIGRDLFGRLAGLLAGLLAALSAPLLVFEHTLMPETLFGLSITLAIWLAIRGLQRGSRWSLVGAGLALGLAYQCRPSALAIVPAAWLGLLLQPGGRRRLAQAGLLTLGFLAFAAPGFVWNRVRHGESAPVMGEFLYARVARHNVGFELPPVDSPAPTADPRQAAARRMILEYAWRDPPAPAAVVSDRLQEALGLSQAEADRALRAFGLEVLLPQRDRYLRGALADFRDIMEGDPVGLPLYAWSNVKRRKDWQDNSSIAHVLKPPTDAQRDERPAAERLIERLFQPARHRTLLGGLILLAVIAAIVRPAYRPALLPLLSALAVVLLSAALIGDVSRYRYPVDPLLYVLAAGGVGVALAAALGLARRLPVLRGRAGEGRREELATAKAEAPGQPA